MAMRSLLENNLGMIIAFDGQGTVTFLNGIAREELDYRQGKKKISVEDIFPTLIRENCNYDEYVNSVQGQLIKTVAYRKNNTCFPVMIRFSKLFFEDVGQINAVAGLNIQDEEDAIRELKKVEQEMEQNLKARDSFVANITHELRTPVNGIKGHVKNLLDLETEPSKKSTLGIIIQCCNNMEKIINNLLDFSKMEAGKFEICEKPFEFKSCVNQAMDTNRPVANQKGLHFHAFVAEDVPQTVIGDELRITQIMNNLLSNALKFTSMGAVTLEVYKTHQREDVVELTFFVTDTGIGIDAQGRQKLFQSFSQADDSITRRYGGTGLGLYVTKQLAEQMHGHIEVESEPGRGSTFSCAIKVKVPVQAVKQEKEQNIEFDISNLKNHLLGTQAKSRMEQVYMYGSAANRRELAINMEKLVLCIEMENWEKAERAIVEACEEKGLKAKVEYGEAAFYGPKLDFMVKDAIGRRWQLGTIQVDYNLPERFQLEYMGSDNQKHRPVMIHRAPFGSMERFVAVLIEHTAGKFPLWLTPDQVAILPISEKFNDYADKVRMELRKYDVRALVDDRNEKIGRKIRDNEMKRIPYMLIVGEKEAENGEVAVRKQGEGDKGTMKIEEFAKNIAEEVHNMINKW